MPLTVHLHVCGCVRALSDLGQQSFEDMSHFEVDLWRLSSLTRHTQHSDDSTATVPMGNTIATDLAMQSKNNQATANTPLSWSENYEIAEFNALCHELESVDKKHHEPEHVSHSTSHTTPVIHADVTTHVSCKHVQNKTLCLKCKAL